MVVAYVPMCVSEFVLVEVDYNPITLELNSLFLCKKSHSILIIALFCKS